jgi:phosphatidylserine/phosphatidylglycerophosphate/cardiolipin synthase-like enzyme
MLNHPDYDQFLKKIMNLSFTFIPIEKADFLHSFCPKKDDFIPQKMSNEFLNLIAGSQKSVIIETPYLVCTKELTELVKQLRNRNVKVTFITNSFCSTDITVAAAAYDLKKKELIDLGVELYEYAGDSYLHAKTALLDKKIGFIGTYNMDPRSASINTETMFMFKGDQATQELYNKMQEDIDMSNKVGLVDGKISWEDQNCEKADLDWLLYTIFQVLSRIPVVYNLL